MSPAYDINSVTPAHGLHLNINATDNRLDYEIAMEVIDFFRIQPDRAREIKTEACQSVEQWDKKAKAIGFTRIEIEQMAGAFS